MALLSLVLGAFAAAGCKRTEIRSDPHAETKQLFDSVCGKCHGSDGKGGVPAAEGLPAPRNFCDAAFQASRTDDDLKKAIKDGKGPMPAFGALFDDRQLTLLVAYIRGFNPKK
ncbi:MAG: cytochrome c [Planctomycetia bacterium]|nr:cytochrome c [Planctomycetia bacterium]